MKPERVSIVEKILGDNDQLAVLNCKRLDQVGVFSINLMASPDDGKNSLILQTNQVLSHGIRIGVAESDTAHVIIDTDKIIAVGIPIVQINTGGLSSRCSDAP